MILIDSNVPMYVVGGPHPHKEEAQRLLDDAILRSDRLVTDVEVLQEIMHRFTAIRRPEAIQPAFDILLAVVDEVLPVDLPIIENAKRIVLGAYGLSARDALHVAVMQEAGMARIMSFDADYDRYPGLERLR